MQRVVSKAAPLSEHIFVKYLRVRRFSNYFLEPEKKNSLNGSCRLKIEVLLFEVLRCWKILHEMSPFAHPLSYKTKLH